MTLQEFGDYYIAPLYQLIGGALAVIIIVAAVWLVFGHIIKRHF